MSAFDSSPIIEPTTVLWQVPGEQPGRPIPSSLQYDPTDPYAISIVFNAPENGTSDDITWTFARDLANRGRYFPHCDRAQGDVQMWETHDESVVACHIKSPSGRGDFLLPRQCLDVVLELSYQRVPSGQESAIMAPIIDAAIGHILTTANS